MKNVLIINGHQKWDGFSEGKLSKSINKKVSEVLKGKFNINYSFVDQDYEISEEIQKIKNADIVIYNFPIFWMGSPWKFKKYIDEIFMNGRDILFESDGRTRENPDAENYGNGGLCQTKKFMIISSMNAPEGSFGKGNFFDGDFDKLVFWLIKNNHWIGIRNQYPSHVFYDVVKNPTIEQGMLELEEKLNLIQYN